MKSVALNYELRWPTGEIKRSIFAASFNILEESSETESLEEFFDLLPIHLLYGVEPEGNEENPLILYWL